MSNGKLDFFRFNLMRVRRRLKRYFKQWFGEQVFFRSRLAQALLAYRVEGRHIIQPLPYAYINDMEYDFDTVIGNSLFYGGNFELEEVKYFARLMQKLDDHPIVLDIGANIGVHSLAWAETNRNATIYAFEPSEATTNILSRNIAANALGNRVHPIREAVSDKVGTATFYSCADNAFSALKDTKRVEVVSSTTVSTTTIDNFVEKNGLPKVTFIKIDVEGFETEVVLGGLKTLKTFQPDLFVEIYGGENANPDPEKTIKAITNLGYSAYVFVGGNMVPYVKHSDVNYNYYFTMHPDRLDR